MMFGEANLMPTPEIKIEDAKETHRLESLFHPSYIPLTTLIHPCSTPVSPLLHPLTLLLHPTYTSLLHPSNLNCTGWGECKASAKLYSSPHKKPVSASPQTDAPRLRCAYHTRVQHQRHHPHRRLPLTLKCVSQPSRRRSQTNKTKAKQRQGFRVAVAPHTLQPPLTPWLVPSRPRASPPAARRREGREGWRATRRRGRSRWSCTATEVLLAAARGVPRATASADKTVILWDAFPWNEGATLKGHGGEVFSCAWSPDAKRLATASADKTVRVWDVNTRREVAKLEGHHDVVESCAWSPGGTLNASASADGTVRVWDVNTGSEVAKLEGHDGGAVYSCAWSPCPAAPSSPPPRQT